MTRINRHNPNVMMTFPIDEEIFSMIGFESLYTINPAATLMMMVNGIINSCIGTEIASPLVVCI